MKRTSWRRIRNITLAIVCALVFIAVPGAGPVRGGTPIFVLSDGTLARWFSFPINYRTDLVSGGATLSKAQFDQVVSDAFGIWTAVPTSKVSAAKVGDLPSDVATFAQFQALTCTDNPMVFDETGAIIDGAFGAGASDSVLGFAGACAINTITGEIAGGNAVLNGKSGIVSTPNDLLGTAVHEFGHLLGLGHSQVNLNCSTNPVSCPSNSDDIFGVPTMFPTGLPQVENTGAPQDFAITLAADDIAWISFLYPETNNNGTTQIPFTSVFGILSGRMLTTDGLSSIQGANLIGRQPDDGTTAGVNEARRCAISTFSGYKYTGNLGLGTLKDTDGLTILNPGSTNGSKDGNLAGFWEVPVFGSGATAAGVPAGCSTAVAVLGSYSGEVESIDPTFTGGLQRRSAWQ